METWGNRQWHLWRTMVIMGTMVTWEDNGDMGDNVDMGEIVTS